MAKKSMAVFLCVMTLVSGNMRGMTAGHVHAEEEPIQMNETEITNLFPETEFFTEEEPPVVPPESDSEIQEKQESGAENGSFSEIEPEREPAPDLVQTEPAAGPETEPETEPAVGPETEPEAEPAAGPETETEAETESTAESETEAEMKPETEEETRIEEPETEQFSETEQTPESESESESEAAAETEVDTEYAADTEKDPDAETEYETETDAEAETEMEAETETETEAETEMEAETETETETETEAEIETEAESETEVEKETEAETAKREEKNSSVSGNQGQSAPGSYYWDASWYIKQDFRFTQVEKTYAISNAANETYVYEQPDQTAKKVGVLPSFSIAYILETATEAEGEQWLYIESGDVRGFVKSSELTQGKFAEDTADAIGEEAFLTGQAYCEKADNGAFVYTHTTVQEVLAEKDYAVFLWAGTINEYADPSSRAVGEVESGDIACVLTEADEGWLFVESGDVRGFVRSDAVLVGKTAEAVVSDMGENEAELAKERIAPEENRSVYYTLTSTKAAASDMGEQIAEYAASFVGKLPYIWGGTSLESGADCSGFVQSVYASFGVSLPRLAEEQGVSGEQVTSLEDARPGDVVYWADGPHVGIYIGDGKVVQCSGGSGNTYGNPGKGPTISSAEYRPITSIRRYLVQSSDYAGAGKYRRDATRYTQAQLELIWAIVSQEDNGSYEGALAVISSAMNRTESASWGGLGGNALSQLTAPGQYCYSMDSYWKPRLGGNVPDYVKKAVDDCLNKGIRNHSYTSFRSQKGSQTGANAERIGGNWFFGA